MYLRPDDITIAITVYSRRDYVSGAIRSALAQTVPVKVIVVEDCGPDPALKDFILKEFGNKIEYFRNPENRGLFDNWHACMEYCRTPWLSILHDDDLLCPDFIETMIALAEKAPDRALYFGRQATLEDKNGKIYPSAPVSWENGWCEMDLLAAVDNCPFFFPGQLFSVATAQTIGGFNTASHLTGDWDMWFRLALKAGAAQSSTEVAVSRSHEGIDRGTSRVLQKGWKWALDNVQRKRNIALLYRERGIFVRFDRAKLLTGLPIPSRYVIWPAKNFTRRILFYNWWLFTRSRPPHWRYAILQFLVRLAGPQSLRRVSMVLAGIRKKPGR